MKHSNINFMQVTRTIWDYDLSDKAKLLFFWLNELEQRYTGDGKEHFYHTDQELAKEMGWSLKTLKAAKAELKKTDLIKFGIVHWWEDEEHTKRSKRYVTSYRIIK